jgi:hypothetical protein
MFLDMSLQIFTWGAFDTTNKWKEKKIRFKWSLKDQKNPKEPNPKNPKNQIPSTKP